MNVIRSEFAANVSLIPTTAKPQWMEPAPIRTYRRTYGVLAIAQRHPLLFSSLVKLMSRPKATTGLTRSK